MIMPPPRNSYQHQLIFFFFSKLQLSIKKNVFNLKKKSETKIKKENSLKKHRKNLSFFIYFWTPDLTNAFLFLDLPLTNVFCTSQCIYFWTPPTHKFIYFWDTPLTNAFIFGTPSSQMHLFLGTPLTNVFIFGPPLQNQKNRITMQSRLRKISPPLPHPASSF